MYIYLVLYSIYSGSENLGYLLQKKSGWCTSSCFPATPRNNSRALVEVIAHHFWWWELLTARQHILLDVALSIQKMANRLWHEDMGEIIYERRMFHRHIWPAECPVQIRKSAIWKVHGIPVGAQKLTFQSLSFEAASQKSWGLIILLCWAKLRFDI